MNFPITKQPKPPWSIDPEDNIIRSKMESGMEITRPRYTRIRDNVTLKWDLTNTEYKIISAFFRINTRGGSLPFTLSFSTIGDDPVVFTYTNVRFSKPIKSDYQGMGVWEVECSFREC